MMNPATDIRRGKKYRRPKPEDVLTFLRIDSVVALPPSIISGSANSDLVPVLQDFKDFIEADSRLFMLFHQMWEQENKQEYAGHVTIRDYEHMFEALNIALRSTPKWDEDAHRVGSAGLPLCDIFYYAVATPAGYAAFTDPGVTRMLKKMLCEWGEYLKTAESARELDSWLAHTGGHHALVKMANRPRGTDLRFEELFVCDADQDLYGFQSWDDFFTRPFRHGVRPVASPDDDNVIANACESKRYNLAYNIQHHDDFWAKGNKYSLRDMFNDDAIAEQFVGGTIYQAFLSTYSYHRWHAPVSGRVKNVYTLEGTYFTIPSFNEPHSRALRDTENINPEEWQAWLSAVGTRGVTIIEADNPALGLVALITIGMVEVSSIDNWVKQGDHVTKGDVMGTFHFGGSSHCLIFQPGVYVGDFPLEQDVPENFPLNGPVARLRV